jgi:hypothetical protein
VQWEKRQDGSWFPIISESDIGPGAVKVMNIQPLYYIMQLDRIEPANQFSAARYVISIVEQNAQEPYQRRPHQHYVSVGEKDEALSLISASGPANAPELTLQILASGETVTLGQNKPYQEVDGYATELAYPPDPPEAKTWKDLRVGVDLKISGKDYKVVVIDPNEVVLSAESNQKKTTLQYQP